MSPLQTNEEDQSADCSQESPRVHCATPWSSPVKILVSGLAILMLASPAAFAFHRIVQTLALPASWQLVAQVSNAAALAAVPLMLFYFLFAALVVLTSPFREESRRYLPYVYGGVLGFLVSIPIARIIGDPAFLRPAWVRAAEQAEPLIAAIEQYNADHGEFPSSLDALVPNYLNEIPFTGMVGYTDFMYVRSDGETPYKGYEVFIPTSFGWSFDRLVYWPPGSDMSKMYNFGSQDPVGDWVYTFD